MPVISIKSNLRDYEVHFGNIQDYLKELNLIKQKVYIVDENVWHYYSDNTLSTLPIEDVIIFGVSEEIKNIEGAKEIYDQLLEKSAKRNLTLITIGGGILQDVSGFVASTLYRGINWVFIPTTLLSQADSCIGSKTSLNYKGYKNIIGSFYPPIKVWIDTNFLKSLKLEDFYSGLGEVLKLHIMGGKRSIDQILDVYDSIGVADIQCLEKVILKSLEIKKRFIGDDEFDLGQRNMLNYGHCFGHAIETVSEFTIPHGQAVVIGMIMANTVACERKLLSNDTNDFLNHSLLFPSLKSLITENDLNPNTIIEAMKKDKKRIGSELTLVMIADNEKMVRVNDLTIQEVILAIRSFRDFWDISCKPISH